MNLSQISLLPNTNIHIQVVKTPNRQNTFLTILNLMVIFCWVCLPYFISFLFSIKTYNVSLNLRHYRSLYLKIWAPPPQRTKPLFGEVGRVVVVSWVFSPFFYILKTQQGVSISFTHPLYSLVHHCSLHRLLSILNFWVNILF